jgi:hypothetical protein
MSLPPQLPKWAIQLTRYAVLFTELGHTGGSELLKHKRRQHGHERQDGHASEREGGPVRSMGPIWGVFPR